MDVKIQTEKTYSVSMSEYQARDLLYFVTKVPDADIARNGRQSETLDTIRQTLLNAGLTTKDPE